MLLAGGTSLTRHCVVMAWFRHELTDVMCCTQPKHVGEIGAKRALHRGMAQMSSQSNLVSDHREMQNLRTCWIPLKEAQLQDNPWQDDPFGTGGTDMEQRVLARLKKDFQVGSEDWIGIQVSQERAIEELEEIPVEKNTKEDPHCIPAMHRRYRSLLGQINWLQIRTQFQSCCKFSRCASKAASPTIGDVKALNKLARQLESQSFPDASYRNNEDGSSQRGMTVFSRITRVFLGGWNVIWEPH